MASENDLLGFLNTFFEDRRRDGALVDIEERDVVVGDLMKKDDELDEVGVRKGVSVKVIVERVVAIFGIQTNFDVILGPLVTAKDIFYLAAKVSFYFKDQPADALVFVFGFVSQNLLGERKHAAGSFATAHGA